MAEKDLAVKNKPRYTLGEELFNAISHIAGAVFAFVALILMLIKAAETQNTTGIIAVAIFGLAMFIMFTMSTLYHFLPNNNAKKVFRIFDHCSIPLLIAGTYTPFCLITLKNSGVWGYCIFGFVWFFSILAVIFNSVNLKKYEKFSFVCYLLTGWCVVIAFVPLAKALAFAGIMWLLAGGIAYTVGAVFYAVGKKKRIKFIHSVWHLFVVLGCIFQFISVYVFVL